MVGDLAGVALAAGAGTRLAPITEAVPKPLCPVANRALLDLALDRLATVGAAPAVNAHHHGRDIRAAVGERAHVVEEHPEALGTAGALANLRRWIDGRPVVVVNGDTWCPGSLAPLVEGWDGERIRVLVPGGGDFGPRSPIVGALMPWPDVRGLPVTPTGLYEVSWRAAHEAGRLEVVPHEGPWVDCGGPSDLLKANRDAMDGESVIDPSASIAGMVTVSAIGAGATVLGDAHGSVVFAGAVVGEGEVLRGAIRWTDAAGRPATVIPSAP